MKNKFVYGLLTFLIISLLPISFVYAENAEKAEKGNQTATSTKNITVAVDLQALIEQLQKQIKELQDQFAKLTSEVATVKEEIKLTKNLYKGVSGNEVKEVQKFLKQFSEIYPEGLVTGYYGPLTEKAVKKFQEREGLSATGKIDQTTRGTINEYLAGGTEKKVATPVVTPLATTPVPEVKPTPPIVPISLETEDEIQKVISNLQSNLSGLSPGISEYDSVLGKIAYFQDRLAKSKAANTLINSDIIQIASVGTSKNLCVLTKDGLVYCQTDSKDSKESFTAVPGLTDVKSIATGDRDFVCAVKKDGSAYCWGGKGGNGYGQLGDGTFIDKSEPVQVFGLGPGTTVSISLGSYHACALKTDGSVVCWGSNDSSLDGGQIGDGTTAVVRPKPTQVIGLGPSSASAVYSNHVGNCAVKTDNSIVCWGSVHANGYSGATKPVKISVNLGKVKYLSLGFKITCALKADNSVVCWGQNYCGQLGNSTKTGVTIPTQVIGLGPGSTSAISNESGSFSSALKTDGSVVTWGCGASGDGTVFNKYTPVQVSGLGAGTTVSIANTTPCAIKTDGSVVCWRGGVPTSVPGLK